MKYPIKYHTYVLLNELQKPEFDLVVDSQDLDFWFDLVSMPDEYREDITGMIVYAHDGDLVALWATESVSPENNHAIYHPLPYFAEDPDNVDNMPNYWLPTNEEYQVK